MKKLAILLIEVGLLAPMVPMAYSMAAAFRTGNHAIGPGIDLGLKLGMIGIPVALAGIILLTISLLRRGGSRQT